MALQTSIISCYRLKRVKGKGVRQLMHFINITAINMMSAHQNINGKHMQLQLLSHVRDR